MSKCRLLSVAAFAVSVCAASLVVASAASAAIVTLLAEWLVGGVAVTEALEVQSEGTLLLENTKTLLGKAMILCSGILDGWIGPNGLDWISDVLSLAGVAVGLSSTGAGGELEGESLTCEAQENCSNPLVWPINLEWESLLELLEQGTEEWFVILLFSPTGLEIGWHIVCEGTLGKPEDLCTVSQNVFHLGLTSTGSLGVEISDAFTELAELKLARCTQSNEESGIVETAAGEPGTISLVGGGSLNASSEDEGGSILELP